VITDEVSRSRTLLDSVLVKAQTADQRARASLICRAFEYYEASVLSYTGHKRSKTEAMERAVTNPQTSDARNNAVQALAAKRAALVAEFQHDPVLQHPLSFERFNSLRW
jgi:hypothetical protein